MRGLQGSGKTTHSAKLALKLKKEGHRPLLVDLCAHNDDDHVIYVYKAKTGWGSISKSNTTLLGGREPYYKSIRELVMSYFNFYFNLKRDSNILTSESLQK